MLVYCVEDDQGIRELISCALKSGGYEVEAFEDGASFDAALEKKKPDLILLDIMLPQQDGISLLKKLKEREGFEQIPVIMLTAKADEIDKVVGLEAGADDYMTKPFGVMELLSRIKAVLRRVKKADTQVNQIEIRGVILNFSKRSVHVLGKTAEFTAKEFDILACLMKNKDHVMTREMLMEMVWGYDFEGITRTVDMHIKTIRRKLEALGEQDFIQTVRGIGYKVEERQ